MTQLFLVTDEQNWFIYFFSLVFDLDREHVYTFYTYEI